MLKNFSDSVVRTKYTSRILCDKYFTDWLLASEPTIKLSSFKKLMFIKSSSAEHKGTHNIMLDFDVKELLSKKAMNENYLRASFKEETYIHDSVKEVLPPEAHPDDEFCNRIFYAIWLANKTPYSCHIFTSPEQKEIYDKNQHLKGLTSVRVKTGAEALDKIDEFWKTYTLDKARYAFQNL